MKIEKASWIMTVILFFSMFHIVLIVVPNNVTASTFFVGGSGPGNYTSIQEAIDDASPGSTVFVYEGTYYEGIDITKAISLIGENRDTTVLDNSGMTAAVDINSDWVNVSGLTLMSSGSAARSVVEFWRSENCSIVHNDVISGSTDIYASLSLYFSNGITIAYNTFTDSATAIRLDNSNDNTIVSNVITNNTWEGIELRDSNSNAIQNNTIATIQDVGIRLFFSDSNVIGDNDIDSSRWHGIHLYESRHCVVFGNAMERVGLLISGDSIEHWITHVIDDSNTVGGDPIYFLKNVSGGTVPSDGGQVILVNGTGITIEGMGANNIFREISLAFSSGNTIVNNKVTDSRVGTALIQSDNNYIANNTISCIHESGISSSAGGIALYSSVNNTVANNAVRDCETGIVMGSSSNENVITGNVVSGNIGAVGILVQSSNDSLIVGNKISMNYYGIAISNSGGNKIYHNNFVDNFNHSYDESNGNEWDNGYPSGGNYWSDYQGSDWFSGPGQNLSGQDGIGDVPYDIPGGTSQDRYPLLRPFGEKSIFEDIWFWVLAAVIMVVVISSIFLILYKRRKGRAEEGQPANESLSIMEGEDERLD
ncbi:MAG: right-handed parallel beta-helix repeat-containing protein [Methanobacteriota archaeon]|nr:MAG: right-handed parallel beta-helix repeat-containing protein [Euryarchaeota archaeon]